MTAKHWITAVVLAALLVVLGVFLGSRRDVSPETTDTRILALEDRNSQLSRELELAQREVNRWQELAEDSGRSPIVERFGSGSVEVSAEDEPGVVRDAQVIRADLAEASRQQDGKRWLELLSELASLGEEQYPDVAAQWIRLINMSAVDLDRLGLNRIDLTSMLASEAGIIQFALEDPGLDPTFRKFSAETLASAGFALRRAILDTLDFSIEKDSGVLTPLVRAARDMRDSIYVDRFARLVQRTDLYNDMRHSVAFMIAEIEGDEARRALDVLRASGGYQRILPVLESIYSPPATGLLVTNGFPPGAEVIGLNDIILEYNGHAIRNTADLTLADANTKPGDKVFVRVLRDGGEQILYVTVTDTAPGHLHFDGRPIVK